MSDAVWLLRITHKHGTDVWLHHTETGARASLHAYVDEYWAYEKGDEPMPEDVNEATEAYFSDLEETYELDRYEVGT